MRILAIETSCDETAAAVVENGTRIISSAVASSSDMHQKSGGVIPEIAAREQLKCIIPVIKEVLYGLSLKETASCRHSDSMEILSNNQIDAIAVTVGPGLIGSLLIGVETARTLSYAWEKPIIPVNHLVAHIYANWLNKNQPKFPVLCLVVSGGHTELVLLKNHGDIKYLGSTRDDAAGECFDKTARLLGLAAYNGGPAIAAAAEKFPISNFQFPIKLPRPMINSNDFDFSFSGLKTAIFREVQKLKTMNQFNEETVCYLSYEIQEAITDILTIKLLRAFHQIKPKSLLLAGGVSANSRLREKIKMQIKEEGLPVELFIPPAALCTDNAAAIGACAFFYYRPTLWKKISADPSLDLV